MDTYNYTAKDRNGRTVKGQVGARSEKHAVTVLKERDYFVVSLGLHREFGLAALSMGGRVGGKEVMQFTQQLNTMLNAGMPLTDALTLLQVQSKSGMAKVIGDIAHDVQGGSSFADALAKHSKVFSTVYQALVRAGEASGKLDDVLVRLTENEEKAAEFRAKTKGALVYPSIVFTAMIIVMTLIIVFVIPQMTTLYESFDAELPFITQVMVGIANAIKTFWWLILMALVGGIFALKAYYATPLGRERIDGLLLKLPVFGQLRTKMIMAEMAQTLAMMVASGVSILESLTIVASAVDNVVIKKALVQATTEVEKGVPMAAAFAKYNVFPLVMSQMVSVGEETGELSEILEKVSKYLSSEAEQLIKNLTTAIEPIMMIMLGVMVTIIAFTVFTPLYKITTMF